MRRGKETLIDRWPYDAKDSDGSKASTRQVFSQCSVKIQHDH